MENTKPAAAKNTAVMPIVALALFVVPVILFFLNTFVNSMAIFNEVFLLAVLLSMIAGFALGIVALCRGGRQMGTAGWVIAIVAVVLPSLLAAFVLVLFTGLTTGLIPIM